MAAASVPDAPGWVVITGASRGIGRATALELAKNHGIPVLAVSRDEARLESLAAEAGDGRVTVMRLDVASEDAPNRLSEALSGQRVRALVHNAGVLLKTGFGEHRVAALEHCFRVNAIAPLLITQALVGRMTSDAHVVHIGSMGGYQDSAKFPGLVGYSASKAALACMAQCLAEDLKPFGIRSNCLALGSVDTEMLRDAFPGYGGGASVESMASFIAWFALSGHRYFNGKVLPVSSGTP